MMPNGDPRDGFFYPTLSLMIDSYNLISSAYYLFIFFCGNQRLQLFIFCGNQRLQIPDGVVLIRAHYSTCGSCICNEYVTHCF